MVKKKAIVKRCKKCGKLFALGYNGIAGRLCDGCAQIERDKAGMIKPKGK